MHWNLFNQAVEVYSHYLSLRRYAQDPPHASIHLLFPITPQPLPLHFLALSRLNCRSSRQLMHLSRLRLLHIKESVVITLQVLLLFTINFSSARFS